MGPEQIIGLIFLGIIVGTVGSLIGAGGGFLLMPAFMLLYKDKSPSVLTAISLAVIFANSVSGSIAYAKMNRIVYRAGILFSLAALPGSIAGALVINYLAVRFFDLLFGSIMIMLAAYMLISVKKRIDPFQADAPTKPHFNAKIGMAISTFVGFFSSLLGIGGGVIHVPMMIYILKFPVHFATATSLFTLAIMTLTGTIVNIYEGDLKGQWPLVLILSAGVIIGAQAGAFLSGKFKSLWIIKIMAIALGIVGLKVLYQGL